MRHVLPEWNRRCTHSSAYLTTEYACSGMELSVRTTQFINETLYVFAEGDETEEQ